MKIPTIKLAVFAFGFLLTVQTANAALLDFTDMATPPESDVIASLDNLQWRFDPVPGGHLYLQNPYDSLEATISFADSQDVNSLDMHGHAYSAPNYYTDWNSKYVTISAYAYSQAGADTLLWEDTFDLTNYNDLTMTNWLHIDIGVTNVDYLRFTASKFSLPSIDNLDAVPSAVPLPGAIWLLGSGIVGMIAIRRKSTH